MELTFPIDEDIIWDEGLVNRKYDIIIPDIYTSIGDSVFSSRELTSVRIPGSVTSIGDYAFYSNQLTSVRIPDSVTSIGEGAFWGNQLTSALIAESVTSIGDDAFYDNQLSSYAPLPYNLTSIGARAFAKNQLARVDIPDSVTSIESFAFSDNQLTSVVIPDSVTLISEEAFSDNQLTSVVIPDSVALIGDYAFYDNQLTSVVIPDGVTLIGDYAFYDNQLKSVTIPDSVTSIGIEAFDNNPSLESISISEDATFDLSLFPKGVDIIRRMPTPETSSDIDVPVSKEWSKYLWKKSGKDGIIDYYADKKGKLNKMKNTKIAKKTLSFIDDMLDETESILGLEFNKVKKSNQADIIFQAKSKSKDAATYKTKYGMEVSFSETQKKPTQYDMQQISYLTGFALGLKTLKGKSYDAADSVMAYNYSDEYLGWSNNDINALQSIW